MPSAQPDPGLIAPPEVASPVPQPGAAEQPAPPSGVEEPASSSSAGLESGLIAQWTSGKGSGALSFDGKKSYVAVPNSEGLNPAGAITIAAWIKIADPEQDTYMRVVSKKKAWDEREGYELAYNPSQNLVIVLGGGDDLGRAAGVNLDTEWHHVVAVIDGGKAWLYVDGAERTSDSTVSELRPNSRPLYIGSSSGGSSAYFNGAIADVRIYDRLLSDQEIALLYHT